MRFWKSRPEPQRLAKLVNGSVILALGGKEPSIIMMSFRKVRVEPHGLW